MAIQLEKIHMHRQIPGTCNNSNTNTINNNSINNINDNSIDSYDRDSFSSGHLAVFPIALVHIDVKQGTSINTRTIVYGLLIVFNPKKKLSATEIFHIRLSIIYLYTIVTYESQRSISKLSTISPCLC
jgi:hypothetical protein